MSRIEALEQVRDALACHRDGETYVHPEHGELCLEEVKYCVVDPVLEKRELLAICMQHENDLLTTSHRINNHDGQAVEDPAGVLEVLTVELGGNTPQQVLLIEDDVVVAHWTEGEDY